jgi:hypothetical protein
LKKARITGSALFLFATRANSEGGSDFHDSRSTGSPPKEITTMITHRLASAIAVILALFTIAPATQAAGKILATVNGVEIREDIIQMTQQLEQMTDEKRKQYTDNIVASAINQELLYQAAVAKELDKDPGYLVELENKRMIQQNRESAMLVNLYERSIPEFSTDGDSGSTKG